MPKIEVNEQVFYSLAGTGWKTKEEWLTSLEENLTCAKAELDEESDKSLPESERTLKIELNDTNRPDLWGTAGCARQLRIYNSLTPGSASIHKIPEYLFFSRPGNIKHTKYKVKVDKSVKNVRPFIAGFVACGKTISDPMLRDIIQTQEKLAWNYGRKRRSISMGVYRTGLIKWPIIYKGADPDAVSFEPLHPTASETSDQVNWEGRKLTLRKILKEHPKGREYAFILEKEPIHPLLTDSEGAVLSYPPIINSNDIGAVQVGDDNIFIELTGTDLPSLTLSASIVACDLADNGFTIEPVEFEYEYDLPAGFPTTGFASSRTGTNGQILVTPYYFQEPVFCSLSRVERFLGEKLTAAECVKSLARMGVKAEAATDVERGLSLPDHLLASGQEGVRAWPPEYRNDFLHAADVAEDIMIGRGLGSFKPERPSDSTIGRLLPITLFSRQVKELLIGLGYQEMIYNYLGSRVNLVENMNAAKDSGQNDRIIRIFNPMTENYEYVRDSILASLMASESISGRSVYPHKIFEVGKVAWLDDKENYKSTTRQFAGFLHAGAEANYNTAAAELQTLFYYLSKEYDVKELGASQPDDSRFIPGRAAAIICNGKQVGVFGEMHPQVLENWGVTVPVTGGEIDLDVLLTC